MHNDPNDPYFHRPAPPTVPAAGSGGFAGGPPVAPLPPLPAAPPPEPPKRGFKAWIMAAVGLVLVAGLVGGAIALWGGDERGQLERGGGGTTQEESGGGEESSPEDEEASGGEYNVPEKPCELVDTDKLEEKYGQLVGRPTESVQEDSTEETGRFHLAFCQMIFKDDDNKQTRVIVAVNIMHDADKPSPVDDGKTIGESVGPRYDAMFTRGCSKSDAFDGDWENGVVGSGTGCHLAQGRTTSNVVIRDGNALIAVHVTTQADTSQEDIESHAKELGEEAFGNARKVEGTTA